VAAKAEEKKAAAVKNKGRNDAKKPSDKKKKVKPSIPVANSIKTCKYIRESSSE